MELTILDVDFEPVGLIEIFDSLIWVDKYHEQPGEFNIITYANVSFLSDVAMGRYLRNKDSEHVMVIEDLYIHSNAETGHTVTLKGRSAESILDRRIVWSQTVLSGSFQDCIVRLLNENVINCTDTARNIPNLIYEATDDPYIASINIKNQYTGDYILTVIKDLCVATGIGFKITLSDDNKWVFKLYSGTDRSYNQFENPYVVFSPKFDNIINSDFKESTTTLKTVALVAGEGEGSEKKFQTVGLPGATNTGLDRREMYVEASDISSNTDAGTLTNEEYHALLTQRGLETLSKNSVTRTFEGEIKPNEMLVYKRDFFLGDIVQVVNEFGNESTSRVVEMVYSQDSNGISAYPTFASV